MALYKSLYDRLKSQHEAIEEIISDVGNSRLTYYPSPGKWSIHDNIAHLAKYQPVFLERIHTILKNNSPSFDRYKAENDPEFESWKSRDTSDLLRTLSSDRQIIFNLITALSNAELNMVGVHPKYGKLTVIQWTEFFLLHEAHHVFTIFQLANDTDIG
jgi:hypothetical protein